MEGGDRPVAVLAGHVVDRIVDRAKRASSTEEAPHATGGIDLLTRIDGVTFDEA